MITIFQIASILWSIANGVGRIVQWSGRAINMAKAHFLIYGVAIATGVVTGDVVSVAFMIAKSAVAFGLKTFLGLLNATAIPAIGGDPVTWEDIRQPLARLFATGAEILGALGCPVHPADFAAYLVSTIAAGMAIGLLWMVSRKMLGVGA